MSTLYKLYDKKNQINENLLVQHISGTCKYHRNIGETYKLSDLTPNGLCPHAYFSAYPYILGMLHHVQFDWMKDDKDHVFAQCPSLVRPWVLEIYRKQGKNNDVDVFVRLINRNEDVNIPGAEECECPHQQDEIFKINKGDGKGFCPAAFYQMFPYLREYLKTGESDFIIQGKEFISVCPDNNNNLTFKLIRKNRGGKLDGFAIYRA